MIVWFFVCLFIFIFSTFLHECGHGLSNKINGVSVSTGFNRVGNAYAFPNNNNFRTGFEETQSFLLDFGVPLTLLLAVLFTLLLYREKELKSWGGIIVAGFALCNSIIRLVPCVIVVMNSFLTGSLHMEDEVQTGQLLVEQTGVSWLLFIPLIISITISLICFILSIKRCKKIEYLKFRGMWTCFWVAYIVSFIIENYLDTIIRINWIA